MAELACREFATNESKPSSFNSLVISVKCSLVSIKIWGKGRFPLVGLRGLLDRSVTMSDTPTKVTEDMGS